MHAERGGVWAGEAPGTGHARSMLGSKQCWQARWDQRDEWMQIDLGAIMTVLGNNLTALSAN